MVELEGGRQTGDGRATVEWGDRGDGILLFVHLPKTAGTTFTGVLRRQYASRVVRIDPVWRTDPGLRGLRNRFREAERGGAEVILGHFPYGVHELLEGPYRYVTFLRDPVNRVLSHYHFVLENPDNRQHEALRTLTSGLEGAIADRRFGFLRNLQTVLLAGMTERGRIRPGDLPDDELLERAGTSLESCAVVGLTERFNESLVEMKLAFGWKTPIYEQRNLTRSRPMLEAVPAHVLELIEEQNQLDRVLYERARVSFERRWAASPAGTAEVRRLRRMNAIDLRPRVRRALAGAIRRLRR